MRLTKSVAHLKDRCPEHGFRPLKAGKMHPNALKTLPRSASAPQVYVVMLSSHLFMLRVQFCNTALTHRGVLGANLCNCVIDLFSTESKKQKCPNAPKLAPKRDAKLDAARRNRDVIGSACHIDHGISRRSGRNSANCRSGH